MLAQPLTVLVFIHTEDTRGGGREAAEMIRQLNGRGFDVGLVARGVSPGVLTPVREFLSAGAGRAVEVRPHPADHGEIIGDLREADLLIMPGQAGRFGLVGMTAVTEGTPLLVPAKSGIGLYLGDPELFPAELTRPGLIEENYREPIAVRRWADRMAELLSDPRAGRARADALRDHLREHNSTWQGAAQSLAAIARYTDALAEMITSVAGSS
jgi:hypothetical protein